MYIGYAPSTTMEDERLSSAIDGDMKSSTRRRRIPQIDDDVGNNDTWKVWMQLQIPY